MFQRLIAFLRFGLYQELINDRGRISLLSQASGRLWQVLGPVRFPPGGGFQGIDALLAVPRV
jgi:hypothetical protein